MSSSSAPAALMALISSRPVSGFCAANNRASMTCMRLICPWDRYDLYPNLALNRLRDPVGLTIDLFQLAALDQEANFRFSPGIAQQNPPFPGKFLLRVAHQLHHRRQFFEGRFLLHL